MAAKQSRPTYAELKEMYEAAEQELRELQEKYDDLTGDSNSVHVDDVMEYIRSEKDWKEISVFGAEPILTLPQNVLDVSIVEALADLANKYRPAQLLELLQLMAQPFAADALRAADAEAKMFL